MVPDIPIAEDPRLAKLRLPPGTFIPPSIQDDLLHQGRLLQSLRDLRDVPLINEAFKEFDDAIRTKGETIRNPGAYLAGVIKRHAGLKKQAVEGNGNVLVMGPDLTPAIHQRLHKLVMDGFCTVNDVNDKIIFKIRMLSEENAIRAIDELESVPRGSIRNFGSYFMGILSRFAKDESNSNKREHSDRFHEDRGRNSKSRHRSGSYDSGSGGHHYGPSHYGPAASSSHYGPAAQTSSRGGGRDDGPLPPPPPPIPNRPPPEYIAQYGLPPPQQEYPQRQAGMPSHMQQYPNMYGQPQWAPGQQQPFGAQMMGTEMSSSSASPYGPSSASQQQHYGNNPPPFSNYPPGGMGYQQQQPQQFGYSQNSYPPGAQAANLDDIAKKAEAALQSLNQFM